MGNIKIIGQNQATTATLTDGAATAADMPVENLAVPIPSEKWRMLSSASWLRCDLGATWSAWDVCALLYTDLYPRKNLLDYTFTMHSSGWARTNLNIAGSENSGDVPTGQSQGWTVTTTNAEHKLSSTFTVPAAVQGWGSATYYQPRTLSAYIWFDSVEATYHFRLKFTSSTGDSCQADFTTSSSGDYSVNGVSTTGTGCQNPVGSVTPSGKYYRVEMQFEVRQDEDSLDVELLVLNGSYSDSFAGGSQTVYISHAMLEVGTGATAFDHDDDNGYRAPIGRIDISRNGFGSGDLIEGVLPMSYRSTHLQSFAETMGFSHFIYHVDKRLDPNTLMSNGSRYIEIDFYSEGNASPSAQITAGTLVVGKSFQPAMNLERSTLQVSYNEDSIIVRPGGGVEYRSAERKYRTVQFELTSLTEDEAIGEIGKILRFCGTSKPVLVDINGGDPGEYGQEFLIYGYLDNLGPTRHRYRGRTTGHRYAHSFAITEVLD